MIVDADFEAEVITKTKVIHYRKTGLETSGIHLHSSVMDRPALLLALLCLSGLVDNSKCSWSDEDDYTDIDYGHYDVQESITPETTTPEDDEGMSNNVGGGPTTDYLTYLLSATTEDEHSTTYNYEHQTSTDRPESTKPDGTSLIYSVVNLLTQNYSRTIDNLTTEIRKQQVQITELVKNNTRLQEKVDYVEQQTKTNSVIFFNVPESDRESYKTTLNKVLYVLNKVMKLQTRAEDIAVAMRSDIEEVATYRPIVVR